MNGIPFFSHDYINSAYYGFVKILTDGSKDPVSGRAAIGIFTPEFKIREGYRHS